MTQPTIAAQTPAEVTLEQGEEYYFCSCGRSKDGIFCDGAHKGTSFRPVVIVAEKSGPVQICRCKHSNNLPFCDGSHQQLG